MASYKTYSDVKGKYYYVDYRGNTLDLADAIEPKVHDSAAFTNYYKGGPDFQSINADQPTKYYNNFAGFGYKSTDGDIGAAPARGYYPTVDLTDGDYPSNFWSSAFDSAGKTITITRTDSQLTVGSSVFKPEDFRCNCIPTEFIILLVGGGGGGGGWGRDEHEKDKFVPIAGGAGGGGGYTVAKISLEGLNSTAYVDIGARGSGGTSYSGSGYGSGTMGGTGGDTIFYFSSSNKSNVFVKAYGGTGGELGRGTSEDDHNCRPGDGGAGRNGAWGEYGMSSGYYSDAYAKFGGNGNQALSITRTKTDGLSYKPLHTTSSAKAFTLVLGSNVNGDQFNTRSSDKYGYTGDGLICGIFAGGCSYDIGYYAANTTQKLFGSGGHTEATNSNSSKSNSTATGWATSGGAGRVMLFY